MSRLDDLLVLRVAIDNEIARERGYLERRRQLNERVTVALTRGTWSTRTFAAVCAYFEVDGDTLLSRSLAREVVKARHVAMWVMRQGGQSYSHIGRELGVDHSTVMNGVRRVDKSPDLLSDATHLHDLLGQAA